MSYCEKCKIEVGGDALRCPLCKGMLTGEPEEKYWPVQTEFKKASKLYKRQFQLMVLACILSFIVDIVWNPFPDMQWWPLFVLWAVGIEIAIRSLFLRKYSMPRIVTEISFAICVLLGITAIWFRGAFFSIPLIITGVVIVDLCFALADKKGYSVVFFIWSIFIGLASFIVILILGENSLTWNISLITCAAAFLIITIVKGKYIFSEIKRRVSM